MKRKSLIITLFILLSTAPGIAQTSLSVAERIMHHDTSIVVFKRAENSKFIIAAMINKPTRVFYIINRYGNAWDSIRMRPFDYNVIINQQYDPFAYYKAAQRQIISYRNELIRQLRKDGKLDKNSPFYNAALFEHPEFKDTDSNTAIKNIMKLERGNARDSAYIWVADSDDPKHFENNVAAHQYELSDPGVRSNNRDAIYFINPDNLPRLHRAVLLSKENRVNYYDHIGRIVGSIKIKPEVINNLSKENVFSYYLDFLERSKQNADHRVRELNEKGRSNITYASLKQQADAALTEALDEQRIIDRQIDEANSPDLHGFATRLKKSCSNTADNVPWLNFMGISATDNLTSWDTVGKKVYELTDHRGNVMATITDKRLQHTTNGTSIDYYNDDVATAQDYYSFGSLMPARTYNFTTNYNYRYGFNGKENDNDVGKGIGNQQDYGMRIYDPRVGRFLSVDPLTESYPYYSPYLVSGNNPIKFVDLNGLEEHNPVPESYINPRLMIDMTKAPGSNVNSAGFVRNSRWFWRQMLQKDPEMFSPSNVEEIKAGRAPVVDEQWVKYNPSQGAFIDETLVHHHYEQGNMATPLPESVHKGWFKALHEANPGGRTRALSSSLKNLHEGMGFLMFFYDLLSDNPQALNQQLRAGQEVNKLYYDMETETYFNITSRNVTKDRRGNVISTTVIYDQYMDYDYDQKSGNYIGVGKINTYEATKNEKTGQVTQIPVIMQ
jgi:RHS repeat-associated protein